jgi:signal transduction histidine kinase
MLSLVRQNAGDHLDDPEFQADMLEAIDNALQRMGKVQGHLGSLQSGAAPNWEEVELCSFLEAFSEDARRGLRGLDIEVRCPGPVLFRSDPSMLSTILENLLINSLEAGGAGTKATITVRRLSQGQVSIDVADDGPGISEELLPDRIFEPFQTTKPKGTGIGLWQVKTLATALLGRISVQKPADRGSVIRLLFEKPAVRADGVAPDGEGAGSGIRK